MRELGHTVLLIYPEDRTHPHLFQECDFNISWEQITGMGLNLQVNPFGVLPWPQQPAIAGRFTAVLWDCLSCPPPRRNYKKATGCFNELLRSHAKTAESLLVRYRAYSNDTTIELPYPIEYVFVSRAIDDNHLSVQITMPVDVMKFISEYAAPANVVLLTSNVEMARTIQMLKLFGYTVLVVVPGNGHDILRAAGRPTECVFMGSIVKSIDGKSYSRIIFHIEDLAY